MARISQRISAVTESATLAIDAKAKALKAAGEDVIGFGAGEPDFPTPAHIVAAAVDACQDPRNHKYTPAAGLPELRSAVAAKTLRDSGLAVGAAQVLITNGGKQAVEQTFATLLDPGDEVLMPAPYWTTYPESIRLAGGVPVEVPTGSESGFRVTVAQLEAARTPRTKVLLFVSPSNPTGAVYPSAEVEAIGRWAVEHGVWVVSDEIYEHLVYGSAQFVSMPVVVPELADTCVVVNGVAKTYAMTGWRVGWMVGPADVIAAAANLQSHTTSNVCNVAQRAALAAVAGDLSAVAEMRATYDRRRQTIVAMLRSIPGVSCISPEGAFYAFPDLSGLLGRPLGASGRSVATSLELADLVLDEAKVAFVPGEAFGAPGYARFSYALADDAMVEGVTRLAKLVARADAAVARVLVTEEIAPPGLDLLRQAGHEVDVALGLTPSELLEVVRGAAALIIRSATQVTADLLEAADAMVVVGRAGIGLDNVDVAAATRRGVMVVNAPQSNVLSAAEHTMALLLAQARNIPQAHGALVAGRWERSRWEGVELHGKVLGVVGLGRVGTLVAQRAAAFGMQVVAYDPYVSAERGRQLGVALASLDDVVAAADFLTIHLPKTPETVGIIDADLLARAKPGLRIVNTARGGLVDEKVLAQAVIDGVVAGAAVDVFESEPTTSSPLFELSSVVVTPHLGASTREAQDKAGLTIAEQVQLALAGEFVPFAVNIAAAEVPEAVRPWMPLAERLGRLWGALTRELPDALDVEFVGGLADHDNRILALAALKGLFAVATDEPVSFVNAPQLAEERGLAVRSTNVSAVGGASGSGYTNLIVLRGGDHSVAGTMFGDGSPRVVMLDGHDVELPIARWMLMVHNDDRIGMVAAVATIVANAGCNIVDLKLGRSASGGTAMMALSFEEPVPPEVTVALRGTPGILDAVALAGV